MTNFSFEPAKDATLIKKWLSKEHVSPYFFGEGLENTLKNLDLYVKGINTNGEYSFDHWVASLDGVPIGFLMTSLIEGPHNPDDPYDKWFEEGKTTLTLDLLIGEEAYLGKKLSTPMIKEFIRQKCQHANTIMIDPAQRNTRAIRAYEGAGFVKVATFIPSYDPTPHHMMRFVCSENS